MLRVIRFLIVIILVVGSIFAGDNPNTWYVVRDAANNKEVTKLLHLVAPAGVPADFEFKTKEHLRFLKNRQEAEQVLGKDKASAIYAAGLTMAVLDNKAPLYVFGDSADVQHMQVLYSAGAPAEKLLRAAIVHETTHFFCKRDTEQQIRACEIIGYKTQIEAVNLMASKGQLRGLTNLTADLESNLRTLQSGSPIIGQFALILASKP